MRKLFLLVTLLMTVIQVSAADVSLATAQAKAVNYLQNMAKDKRLAALPANGVKLLHIESNSTRAAQAVYYIFNSDRGFVIVSGDDRAQTILAHGDRPLDLKRMPDNMKFWLSTYKKQLEYLQAHPGLAVDQPKLSRNLNAGKVEPLLTAEWDQSAPYYNHCPTYNGSLCLTVALPLRCRWYSTTGSILPIPRPKSRVIPTTVMVSRSNPCPLSPLTGTTCLTSTRAAILLPRLML